MQPRVLLALLATAGVAAVWFTQQAAAGRLRGRLDEERARQRELLDLRKEHDRLAALAPSAATLAALRAAGAGREPPETMAARPAEPPPAPFQPGEWVDSQTWENRGRATPRATVETVLWAAAGGDVSVLEALLELDAPARVKAEELLARLPVAARVDLDTPEALVASVTAKQIPLTSAQVAWLHETDDKHAAIGLLLSQHDDEPEAPPVEAGPAGNLPPSLPANGAPKLAILTLRRSPDGWRVLVPVKAIERIARTLQPASG